MQQNKLAIVIQKPIEAVFDYTLNPENTPKWISDIEIEETNQWPVQPGTIYRNKSRDDIWRQYKLVELSAPHSFTLASVDDSDFCVKYSFKKLSDNSTEFVYYEWVNEGDIADPFSQSGLEKLKMVLES